MLQSPVLPAQQNGLARWLVVAIMAYLFPYSECARMEPVLGAVAIPVNMMNIFLIIRRIIRLIYGAKGFVTLCAAHASVQPFQFQGWSLITLAQGIPFVRLKKIPAIKTARSRRAIPQTWPPGRSPSDRCSISQSRELTRKWNSRGIITTPGAIMLLSGGAGRIVTRPI